MKEKKVTKISLSTFFLILSLIVIIVMGIFIYKLNNDKTIEIQKSADLQAQVNSLNGTVSNLQGKINSISNTLNASENTINNDSQSKVESSSVSYIVLVIEDLEAKEKNKQLEYKSKKITDKNKIESLMKIIDSATPYNEKSFIADFGDCPPSAEIYLSNGESYTVAAGDEYDDAGNVVNLMTKWYSEDGSNKTLYKVNSKLGEQIEKIFND